MSNTYINKEIAKLRFTDWYHESYTDEQIIKILDDIPVEVIQNHDFLESLIEPRWISVTERLPEKNQIVIAHEGKGTWDFGMFRGISASGNPEYWHWKKNTFKHVKWWMPKDGALPDPPKEEENDRLFIQSSEVELPISWISRCNHPCACSTID